MNESDQKDAIKNELPEEFDQLNSAMDELEASASKLAQASIKAMAKTRATVKAARVPTHEDEMDFADWVDTSGTYGSWRLAFEAGFEEGEKTAMQSRHEQAQENAADPDDVAERLALLLQQMAPEDWDRWLEDLGGEIIEEAVDPYGRGYARGERTVEGLSSLLDLRDEACDAMDRVTDCNIGFVETMRDIAREQGDHKREEAADEMLRDFVAQRDKVRKEIG